ncbi:MAG: hypothetical protein L0Y56_06260 [Nitrospira sp.]|nr:hypothetical protein [Nitrospira sp.]
MPYLSMIVAIAKGPDGSLAHVAVFSNEDEANAFLRAKADQLAIARTRYIEARRASGIEVSTMDFMRDQGFSFHTFQRRVWVPNSPVPPSSPPPVPQEVDTIDLSEMEWVALAEMVSHANRPRIAEALEIDRGSADRLVATLFAKLLRAMS